MLIWNNTCLDLIIRSKTACFRDIFIDEKFVYQILSSLEYYSLVYCVTLIALRVALFVLLCVCVCLCRALCVLLMHSIAV